MIYLPYLKRARSRRLDHPRGTHPLTTHRITIIRDLSVKRNQMEKAHRLSLHTVPLRSIAGTLTWSAQVGGIGSLTGRNTRVPTPRLSTHSFKRVIRYMRRELGRGSRYLISKYPVTTPIRASGTRIQRKGSKKHSFKTAAPDSLCVCKTT